MEFIISNHLYPQVVLNKNHVSASYTYSVSHIEIDSCVFVDACNSITPTADALFKAFYPLLYLIPGYCL
jgi:hypothetical protein